MESNYNTPNSIESLLPEKPSYTWGYFLAFMSAVSNAGYYILGKYVLTAGNPLFIGGLVMSIGALYHFGWVTTRDGGRWFRRISPMGWKFIAIYTVLGIFALTTHWVGLSMLDAVTISFLTRVEVPIIILLSVCFLHERFRPLEAVGGILLLTGAIIIKWTLSFEVSMGFWIVVLSAVFFALLEVVAKKAVKYVEPFHMNTVRNFIIASFMTGFAVFSGHDDWNLDWRIWLGMAATAAFGPLGARMFYLYSLRHIEISKTSLISQSAPIFLVILVVLLYAHLPSTKELAGGMFIVSGCALMILFRPRR